MRTFAAELFSDQWTVSCMEGWGGMSSVASSRCKPCRRASSGRSSTVSCMDGYELLVETMNMIHFSLETKEEPMAWGAWNALHCRSEREALETGELLRFPWMCNDCVNNKWPIRLKCVSIARTSTHWLRSLGIIIVEEARSIERRHCSNCGSILSIDVGTIAFVDLRTFPLLTHVARTFLGRIFNRKVTFQVNPHELW